MRKETITSLSNRQVKGLMQLMKKAKLRKERDVFVTDYDGELNVDPDEIMELRWISLEDLKKEMESEPQKFSTWFLIATPRVMESIAFVGI